MNPQRSIPLAVTAIHGITDAAVASATTFVQLAPTVAARLSDCDLTGYNVARPSIAGCSPPNFAAWESPTRRSGRASSMPMPWLSAKNRGVWTRARCGSTESSRDKALDRRMTPAVMSQRAVAVLVAQLHTYPDLPRTVDGLHHWLNPNRSESD